MTKKELAKKMNEFLATQNSTDKDEWWGTDQCLKGSVLEEFAEFIGITLEEDFSKAT